MQFYNNAPNAVTVPFVPSASLWPTPWTVTDWQAESQGQSFWVSRRPFLPETRCVCVCSLLH